MFKLFALIIYAQLHSLQILFERLQPLLFGHCVDYLCNLFFKALEIIMVSQGVQSFARKNWPNSTKVNAGWVTFSSATSRGYICNGQKDKFVFLQKTRVLRQSAKKYYFRELRVLASQLRDLPQLSGNSDNDRRNFFY